MGHQRHRTSVLSVTSHDAPKGVEANAAHRPQPDASAARRSAADCGETNVWRQARQMRDEWRKHRYARLFG